MKSEDTGDPIRLLLVDDEVEFTSIMVKRLGRRNIRALTAKNGQEAITLISEKKFDAAVLDLKMEGMDGLEVLKIFKKKSPEMPVIMLTGHGSHEAAKEGRAYGAFDYLSKPYEIKELTRIIRNAVSGRKDAS